MIPQIPQLNPNLHYTPFSLLIGIVLAITFIILINKIFDKSYDNQNK
jgi:flagellar biosynthesis protein FliR